MVNYVQISEGTKKLKVFSFMKTLAYFKLKKVEIYFKLIYKDARIMKNCFEEGIYYNSKCTPFMRK